MKKEKWLVHQYHCCALHGCKYGDDDCPVVLMQTRQDYTCEYCSDDGFVEVEEVIELIKLKDEVETMKLSEQETMTVSVELLHRILNRI